MLFEEKQIHTSWFYCLKNYYVLSKISVMWCVITVLVVFAAHHCIAHNLIISLQSGQVRGTTFSTPSGKTFNAWRGIAFAKPPLGDLRFKHPERPKPWDGVLDATKDSKACMNTSYFEGEPEPTYGYSEDCLYVNVYAPIKPNSSVRLPVMFFIWATVEGEHKIESGRVAGDEEMEDSFINLEGPASMFHVLLFLE